MPPASDLLCKAPPPLARQHLLGAPSLVSTRSQRRATMATSGNGTLQPSITAPVHFLKSTDMPSLLEPPADDGNLPSATKGGHHMRRCLSDSPMSMVTEGWLAL